MGVINVTPDSFSGDGLGGDVERALVQALKMVDDGADIIDVGGESTRPGAHPVSVDEEIDRIIPVVTAMARRLLVPISIDTRKAVVAERAVDAGASIINDIWGLKGDEQMARVAAKHQPVGLVIMHNQKGTNYGDLVTDIKAELRGSIDIAVSTGVPEDQVIIDPGFGFGKMPAQNLEMIRQLKSFRELGRPVLIGASNKSTLGLLLGGAPVAERRDASLALAALAIAQGADIVRVHDVKGTDSVRRIADPITRGITDDIRAMKSAGQTL